MYTALLLGGMMAATMACLALGVFFVLAWRGRRQQREYLVFSLLLAAVATMTGLEAAFFWHALTPRGVLDVPLTLNILTVCGRLVPPLLLHFALAYVRRPYNRRVLVAAYGLTAVLVVVAASGGWYVEVAEQLTVVPLVAGIKVHTLHMRLSNIALIAYLPQMLMYGGAVFLIGRYYQQGRRESLGAAIGSALMLLANLHDVGILLGIVDSPPLMPLGMVALGYGVSLTVISRYGKLSRALELRTTQLAERTQQLHALVDEVTAAHTELARGEQMAVVGELAAVVAHQVRNPLAVMRNAITSLRKHQLDLADKSMLRDILREELDRLQSLIAHLLDYSRPVAPRGVKVNLAALAQRCLAVVQDHQHIKAEVTCPTNNPQVEGDPDLLLEAFENIATNAAQSMPDGGTLLVRVSDHTLRGMPALAVCFEDTGDGMSEEALEQAHRPFFTTRPTGTGLGLSLVARIVDAHGGEMELDSIIGRGTKLTLLLPQVRPLVGAAGRNRRMTAHRSLLP